MREREKMEGTERESGGGGRRESEKAEGTERGSGGDGERERERETGDNLFFLM